ncbi:uroporphyrinogen-III synthase [Thecaphora frezii]
MSVNANASANVNDDIEDTTHLVSILLLRSPVPTSQGTDPYHDAFGSFCLPSFAESALESGTSTPLTSHSATLGPLSTAADPSAVDLIKSALSQPYPSAHGLPSSPTGRRKGKFIQDQPRLMTHHLSYPRDAQGSEHEIEYCVTSFPILSYNLVNTDTLADRLLRGHPSASDPQRRVAYRGAIVTSQRAVEAYTQAGVRAYQALRSQGRNTSDSPTQWTRVPFFAVGQATSAALRSVPLAPWLRPKLVMGGDATGTGEALANYVIRHFASAPAPPPLPQQQQKQPAQPVPRDPLDTVLARSASLTDGFDAVSAPLPPKEPQPEPLPEPLLYLVGDKNAPTIPTLLSKAPPPSGPIPFEELQVYETGPDPNFHEGCAALAKSLPAVISRPVSRRPSSSSLRSRPGSRRPSGSSTGGARTPSSADPDYPGPVAGGEMRRTASQGYVPSVGTPLGVSAMTPSVPLAPTTKPLQAAAATFPGGSTAAPGQAGSNDPVLPTATQVTSPTTLNPEPMNPLEEDSILKALRSKAKAQAAAASLLHESSSSSAAAPSSKSSGRIAEARPDWIVFFSPSGVGYALEEFRRRKWLPPPPPTQQQQQQHQQQPTKADETAPASEAEQASSSDGAGSPSAVAAPSCDVGGRSSSSGGAGGRRYPRIAVIGPTTRKWIAENLGIEPDAVAAKPGPKELKEAIEQAEVWAMSAAGAQGRPEPVVHDAAAA